ncbi:MAG: hypothetical protein AAF353_05225 [Pseudomonadota bacterium]
MISLAQNKGLKIIFVQMYHEIKFFPMILLFAVVRCDDRWRARTHRIIKPIVLATFVLILFQIAAPGLYDSVFSNGGHFEKGLIAGMELPRLVGWFWHPGQIALFFMIIVVFYLVEYRKGNVSYVFSMIMTSILLVIISIQRFELFILFIVLMTFWVGRYLNFDYRPYLALVVVGFFGFGMLYVISDQNHFWWLINHFNSPRIVFLVEGLFTLVESDYLGAGWGTIGSHAAADVAQVYDYNAMKDIWWIKLGQFFYDTYWPHVIGETGLPGYFLLLGSMFFMVLALKQREASMLMFILIMTSALSSNVQSLYHLTIFGWFIMLLESNPPHNQRSVPADQPAVSLFNQEGVKP